MAFGYEHNKETKLNIDYSRCAAISVIATFATDGRLKPLFFLVVDSYGNECKTKVDAVKYTKDGKGCTSFCCAYMVGSRQRECILTYYVQEHLWVLEK